ncbi:NusG domain II-containing protein [Candidatus Latescibacterota bacterium]
MIFKYFTRSDIVLITVLLALSISGFAAIRHYGGIGKHAVVEVDGTRVLELSLERNVTTEVDGLLGETVIVVGEGSVRIEDSPCPGKHCIRMGRLSHGGQIAVCVPNRIVVYITGGSENDSYDGVTQ